MAQGPCPTAAVSPKIPKKKQVYYRVDCYKDKPEEAYHACVSLLLFFGNIETKGGGEH